MTRVEGHWLRRFARRAAGWIGALCALVVLLGSDVAAANPPGPITVKELASWFLEGKDLPDADFAEFLGYKALQTGRVSIAGMTPDQQRVLKLAAERQTRVRIADRSEHSAKNLVSIQRGLKGADAFRAFVHEVTHEVGQPFTLRHSSGTVVSEVHANFVAEGTPGDAFQSRLDAALKRTFENYGTRGPGRVPVPMLEGTNGDLGKLREVFEFALENLENSEKPDDVVAFQEYSRQLEAFKKGGSLELPEGGLDGLNKPKYSIPDVVPPGYSASAAESTLLTRFRGWGFGRITYAASIRAASFGLMAIAFGLHAKREGVLPTAAGFVVGGLVWKGATTVAEAGVHGASRLIGLVNLRAGAAVASFGSRAIPVVGWVLLAADVLKESLFYAYGIDEKSRAELGTDRYFGFGFVWDAWTGAYDRPTTLAGIPPPADQGAYYD